MLCRTLSRRCVWSSGIRSNRSKSLAIRPRTSGARRFPAATPSSAPPAIGAAPKARFAIPDMFPPSFHQCRGQRATELIRPFASAGVDGADDFEHVGGLGQREPGGHLVYRVGRATGVVIAMHPQAVWPAGHVIEARVVDGVEEMLQRAGHVTPIGGGAEKRPVRV